MIVPERSPAALAEVICTLQGDPRRTRELGAAGLATVHAEFTWEMVAKKMANVYEKMLSRGPSTAQERFPISPTFAVGDHRSLPAATIALANTAERSSAVVSSHS